MSDTLMDSDVKFSVIEDFRVDRRDYTIISTGYRQFKIEIIEDNQLYRGVRYVFNANGVDIINTDKSSHMLTLLSNLSSLLEDGCKMLVDYKTKHNHDDISEWGKVKIGVE